MEGRAERGAHRWVEPSILWDVEVEWRWACDFEQTLVYASKVPPPQLGSLRSWVAGSANSFSICHLKGDLHRLLWLIHHWVWRIVERMQTLRRDSALLFLECWTLCWTSAHSWLHDGLSASPCPCLVFRAPWFPRSDTCTFAIPLPLCCDNTFFSSQTTASLSLSFVQGPAWP